MRGHKFVVVAVLLVLAAGCGGDGGSLPPATDPTTPPSMSTTTEPVRPDTTARPSVVTTIEAAAVATVVVLRPDGLGPVDLGAPAEETVREHTELFGEPTSDVPIGPDGECVEGADWLDCVKGLRVIEQGRLLTWADLGLEVALVDSDATGADAGRVPLQFGDWHATATSDSTRLQTPEGIFPGITIGELRLLAPELEFGYGEGLLDGVFVTAPTGGGYWGDLDWDAATTPVEHVDIRAVQAALNAHGATLDVDGAWGPETENAWLDFLADHGIEPVTSQLWLTPEVGDALGLPPDDIIVANIQPRPADESSESSAPSSPELTLRADGIGRFDFGEPADGLLGEIISMFGPPSDTVEFSASPPGDTVSSEPECVLAIQQTRTVHWETIDLHVVFTDWPGSDQLPPAPLHFASWTLGPPSTSRTHLATPDGIRIGSTAADVRSLPNSSPMIPDVTQWGFTIADDTGTVSGQFAWPVNLPYYFIDEQFAVELQQALNDHGATLAVDGVVGPATMQALIDFAAQHDIDGFGIEPARDSIQLTPEVLEVFWLLELPPDDAPVTYMWAGDQSTCG